VTRHWRSGTGSGGYRVTPTVVETAAGTKAALAEQAFDIALADVNLPQFDALGALPFSGKAGLISLSSSSQALSATRPRSS